MKTSDSAPETAVMKREYLTQVQAKGRRALLHTVLTATPDGNVTRAYRIFIEVESVTVRDSFFLPNAHSGTFKPTTETWYDNFDTMVAQEGLR